ncbi:hypothetical protein ABID22_003306 [Pontibacter aydingkolensis]
MILYQDEINVTITGSGTGQRRIRAWFILNATILHANND